MSGKLSFAFGDGAALGAGNDRFPGSAILSQADQATFMTARPLAFETIDANFGGTPMIIDFGADESSEADSETPANLHQQVAAIKRSNPGSQSGALAC